MKRFVTGQAREQATLFPERLDDFIDEDNPIRVVDLFVDALDLRELDSADQEEPTITDAKSERLPKKITENKEEIERIEALEPQMLASEDQQISLTDPDARAMKCRGAAVVAYNVQTAVEPRACFAARSSPITRNTTNPAARPVRR